jgi:hypothetical protein
MYISNHECNGKKYVYKRVLYVSLKLFLRCVDYLLCKKVVYFSVVVISVFYSILLKQ